jgi:hypothetical protein
MPSFNPCRISSSSSEPFSKYFSINFSSFSAAFSTNSLCSRSAFSFSAAGMLCFSGLPPSSGNTYITIFSKSMILLKSSPSESGYCICVTALPNRSRSDCNESSKIDFG